MNIDRKKFFDGVKARFDPTLSQEQVDGFDFLLKSFENEPLWADVRHVAYALATIWHETATSMQPVEEGYYLGKKAKAFQKKLRYYPYYGRGYVQLTWKTNYEKAGSTLGVDLVNHPDLALEPQTAFMVLTVGLFRGWFGGKLTTYINSTETDYINARRCVNVLDKAGLIAGYAAGFEKILNSAAEPTDGNGQVGPGPVSPDNPTPAIGGDGLSEQPPTPTPPQAENQTIVDVPPVATEPPEGIVSKFKTWYAALPAFLTAALGGFISWLQGAATEIIVAFLVTAGVVAIVFIVTNFLARRADKRQDFEAKEKQKERDFELTKLQMQSAMDPTKQTVRISQPSIVVPNADESAGK